MAYDCVVCFCLFQKLFWADSEAPAIKSCDVTSCSWSIATEVDGNTKYIDPDTGLQTNALMKPRACLRNTTCTSILQVDYVDTYTS